MGMTPFGTIGAAKHPKGFYYGPNHTRYKNVYGSVDVILLARKGGKDGKSSTKGPSRIDAESLSTDKSSSPDFIPMDEINQAFSTALTLSSQSQDLFRKSGWNEVHVSDVFSLYKRRDSGAVVYMMTGRFTDISPRSFLIAQFDKDKRKLWDKTMKEMRTICGKQLSARDSDDNIYFRTTWPFPLKDRDYVLGRR